LIPAIVQEAGTGRVLMMAWLNKESLAKTLELGEMVYWSRSRKELWHKGATSGHTQKVKSLAFDCDKDCMLAQVEQVGAACIDQGQALGDLFDCPADDVGHAVSGLKWIKKFV
jgi:phosphoribosyl-AMP cyclohydrolase